MTLNSPTFTLSVITPNLMTSAFHYNQGRCYLTIESRDDQYVAVAHNVEKGVSMEMSNPRPYANTLQWVLKFIGQVPPIDYDAYEQYLSERLGF